MRQAQNDFAQLQVEADRDFQRAIKQLTQRAVVDLSRVVENGKRR